MSPCLYLFQVRKVLSLRHGAGPSSEALLDSCGLWASVRRWGALGCPVWVCCLVPVCAQRPGWRGRVWGGGNHWDGPALMSVISLHSHRL